MLNARVKEMAQNKRQANIARAHYNAYRNSYDARLSDVYTSYSVYKKNAYNRCVELMHNLGGWGLAIISYNSQAFTVGFMFCDDETGEVMFAYITKDYDRYCYITE